MCVSALLSFVADKGGASAHFVSLFRLFCSAPLPETGNTVPNGTTCSRNIPGTDVFAFQNDEDGHPNVVGMLYIWPFLCEAMSSIGLQN